MKILLAVTHSLTLNYQWLNNPKSTKAVPPPPPLPIPPNCLANISSDRVSKDRWLISNASMLRKCARHYQQTRSNGYYHVYIPNETNMILIKLTFCCKFWPHLFVRVSKLNNVIWICLTMLVVTVFASLHFSIISWPKTVLLLLFFKCPGNFPSSYQDLMFIFLFYKKPQRPVAQKHW